MVAPVHLGPVVNSTALDAGPSISRDGLSLYFHSARAGLPSNPGSVSLAPGGDRPAVGSAGQTRTGDRHGFGRAGPTVSKNGHFLFFGAFRSGSFDVYVRVARTRPTISPGKRRWPCRRQSTGPRSTSRPTISRTRTATRSLFASDRANGLGAPGLDIYVSELRRDGTWSDPVYVSELNSAFQDDRPAIRADGLEIIFGSSREGSLDLYVSRRDHVHDAWSAPENLGAVVNSTGNDIHPALSANGRTLYSRRTAPATSICMRARDRRSGTRPDGRVSAGRAPIRPSRSLDLASGPSSCRRGTSSAARRAPSRA